MRPIFTTYLEYQNNQINFGMITFVHQFCVQLPS